MNIVKLFAITVLLSSAAHTKNIALLPETFPSAQITLALDKTIKLNKKNKFRSILPIDSNNRCIFSSNSVEMELSKNTEWKSQTNIDWSDWDSKNYSFKITNNKSTAVLTCEMNLTGEVLLFNAGPEKKSISACKKQGGHVQNSPPKSYTQNGAKSSSRAPASVRTQSYCIKKIPKVTIAKFKTAFQKAKIKMDIEFPTEAPQENF